MLTTLADHMNEELLKYAVGRQMFCPQCERCLDWRNAALVTGTYLGSPKDELVRCSCGRCSDEYVAMVQAASEKTGVPVELEVVDGRHLSHPKLDTTW